MRYGCRLTHPTQGWYLISWQIPCEFGRYPLFYDQLWPDNFCKPSFPDNNVADDFPMDIEFHYYMTYLTAARAGFAPPDAEIIAYSSQYVDENIHVLHIDRGKPTAYHNYITQTLNILKPKHELMRIYPIFHFIPGDPSAPTAQRKDGRQHPLNTTPNSENANLIFDDALQSRNLYRIGIAAHSYMDTWAHQNFVGYYDSFNAMQGILNKTLPNIGHADAKHNPDWPALV